MKLSARNQIKGKIISIEKGTVNDIVTLDIGNNSQITAMITTGSVNNLGLKVGNEAFAIIKASTVMIGTND
jgi:molybdopterin-binding protein